MGSNRRVSRRSFFKQTGAAVAALGLTELAINSGLTQLVGPSGQALGQALAQSTGRKLALLIGIDKYPSGTISPEQSAHLSGAVTDVSLQKELLIHRFGFLPRDIVCLTNKQATRAGIYRAIVDHLYNQATSSDTVVFHFSGYGAQVRIADLVGGQATRRSLVPYDGNLPTESRPILNDILETELKALLGQLKTKTITTILDTGFVDITVPLSGGLRSRARPVIATGRPSPPFALLTDQKNVKESALFPGILLRGADTDEVVIERQWDDFNAGAFTYVLTQYLWTAPAPVTVGHTLGRVQEGLLRWGGSNQQPILGGSRKVDLSHPDKTPPLYSTPLLDGTRAEGVVHNISADGQKATLWLGGFPPRVLEYLATPAILTCAGRQFKVRSRDGLMAKVRLIESSSHKSSSHKATPIHRGQPVFEAVRALPKSINLVVALDSRLERIERVDATSALSVLDFVSSTSDTELPADCLLAKPVADKTETLTASLNPIQLIQRAPTDQPGEQFMGQASDQPSQDLPTDPPGQTGYGLFSLTRSLIPGTLALQDEAIKPAISRLTPKLQALLALKMLRLSENRAFSRLPVRIDLETIGPKSQLLIHRQTFQVNSQIPAGDRKELSREGFSPQVPVGNRIRYRLFNDGEMPLYYTLINVDPREHLSAFCPVIDMPTSADTDEKAQTSPEIAAAAIAPGSSITVPGTDIGWAVDAPTGPVETYVVCSTLPLNKTFKTLLTASANSGGQRINPLPHPLTVVEALLTDMSQGDDDDVYTLDVSQWATLNFTYQAV